MIVSYSGVHQAFQIALAAHESGLLETFYTAVFEGEKSWGRVLRLLVGAETLRSRSCDGLHSDRVKELPVEFLLHRAAAVLGAQRFYPWYEANFDFDAKVSKRLGRTESRMFVGVETCARDSFRVAGQRGMIKLLDCPQVHPDFLTRLLNDAAEDLGVPRPPAFDPPELAKRKQEEFELADHILVISEVHRRSFIQAGFRAERLEEIPLWVDPKLWFPPEHSGPGSDRGPLRILFVGTPGLRKGVPYLVQAVERCGYGVKLIFVGADSRDATQFVHAARVPIEFAGRRNKAELRQLYWNADLLVLPSLVDSFGFVALEAMACGLPVIVTENCGVPVPDPAWRVPIMNSERIAQRLAYYAADRDALRRDGARAREFSRLFAPEQYRTRIKEFLFRLLASRK